MKRPRLLQSSQTIRAKKLYTLAGAKGQVTYEKASGTTPAIAVAANGAITVGFGLTTGKYPVKVKVAASGNAKFKPASKAVKLRIRVA